MGQWEHDIDTKGPETGTEVPEIVLENMDGEKREVLTTFAPKMKD